MKKIILLFFGILLLSITGCVGEAINSFHTMITDTLNSGPKESGKNHDPIKFDNIPLGEKHTLMHFMPPPTVRHRITEHNAGTGVTNIDGKNINVINHARHDVVFFDDNDRTFTQRVKEFNLDFDDTVTSPILVNTDISRENWGNYTYKIKIPGGYFCILDEQGNQREMSYYWMQGEVSHENYAIKGITIHPVPEGFFEYFVGEGRYANIMVYQNGSYVAAYVNGKLLSESRINGSNKPGIAGIAASLEFHSSFDTTLRDTYVATGRLAWGLKESIADSRKNKDIGANPYEEKFDIEFSSGVNHRKARSETIKNNVAEARLNYRTVDLRVKIKPIASSDLTYPMYINVTYDHAYTQEIKSNHYIIGNMTKIVPYYGSIEKQYYIESPSTVIEDVYSFEYLLNVINSDMTNTQSMKIISDPVISVNVTGAAFVPN